MREGSDEHLRSGGGNGGRTSGGAAGSERAGNGGLGNGGAGNGASRGGGPNDGSPGGGVRPAGGDRRVCVGFKGRRVEVFEAGEGAEVHPGMQVVVEADRGVDVGQVLDLSPADVPPRRGETRPRRLLRAAAEEELELLAALRAEDAAALETTRERVRRFGLPMHLVDAEYQFDRSRVTFYFTADHRVDFRELVRDLASIFRTRIELRQIGTREAARRLGGIGTCGRECCCRAFLWDFERVTLQMARQQNLAINPSRLSGLCGRLLCCLGYEGLRAGAAECPCRPGPPAVETGGET